MRLNQTVRSNLRTHEGAPAHPINPEQQLRRSVMACMLWERQFYEDGQEIATRIAELVPHVDAATAAGMAIEAREQMHLRHAPLLLVREMARQPSHRGHVRETLTRIIQRADELAEFLALYWQDGKQPLAASVKKGLADAFGKFDEYQFAKYDRDYAVKLRDVMFVTHPRPAAQQQELFRRIAERNLSTPDTWEVALSGSEGEDKRAQWERLLRENRMGGLALLRNLRNMDEAGADEALIREAIANMSTRRILPFRFIAAARHAPRWESWLEEKLVSSVSGEKAPGRTIILVDVSGSMDAPLSTRSDMNRRDAACGVAMVGRELYEDVRVFTFSNQLVEVPPRRGFALRDAITHSQSHMGTHLGRALNELPPAERYIVMTDEQTADAVGWSGTTGYMINVASYRNGVGYGKWTHIDGFSEAVFRYIREVERQAAPAIAA